MRSLWIGLRNCGGYSLLLGDIIYNNVFSMTLLGISIDPLSIPQILMAFLLMAESIFVLRRDFYSPMGRSFFLLQLSVFVWLVGTGISYSMADLSGAFFFAKIGF